MKTLTSSAGPSAAHTDAANAGVSAAAADGAASAWSAGTDSAVPTKVCGRVKRQPTRAGRATRASSSWADATPPAPDGSPTAAPRADRRGAPSAPRRAGGMRSAPTAAAPKATTTATRIAAPSPTDDES